MSVDGSFAARMIEVRDAGQAGMLKPNNDLFVTSLDNSLFIIHLNFALTKTVLPEQILNR
jgi:hypothetical protein